MKKWITWKRLVAVILLVLIVFWLVRPKDEAVHYLSDTVTRTDIALRVHAIGEIGALQFVDVGAQASGQIKKLAVKMGDVVKKGQLIAEIDAVSQTNQLHIHEARLATYKAQLTSAQLRLQSAQKQFNRYQKLHQSGAVSSREAENAADALALARAQVAELKSSIKQTQIAITTAKTELDYTRIVSPIDGTVVAVWVEEGQSMNANLSTPTVVQVANLNKMLNKMQISENDMGRVKAGQKLVFTTPAYAQKTYQTILSGIDPALTMVSQGAYRSTTDLGNSAIYYYARAEIDNTDGSLKIGMTTQNDIIITEKKQVLTVAEQAIKRDGDQEYVEVLGDNDSVQKVTVTTGISDGVRREVVTGLNENARVVIGRMSAKDAARAATGFDLQG